MKCRSSVSRFVGSRPASDPSVQRTSRPARTFSLRHPARRRPRRAAQADTIGTPIPLFTYRDLVLAGSVVVATIIARPFDERIARAAAGFVDAGQSAAPEARHLRAHHRHAGLVLHRRVRCTPPAASADKDKLADLGLHGTEALLVGEVGRRRDQERRRPTAALRACRAIRSSYQLFRGLQERQQFRSFPSGHTTSAFAAAAAVIERDVALVAGARDGSSGRSCTAGRRSPVSRACTTTATG